MEINNKMKTVIWNVVLIVIAIYFILNSETRTDSFKKPLLYIGWLVLVLCMLNMLLIMYALYNGV